ncbi:hypothetical protein BBP40_005894 [Aspergillus hancockii]|nr:hypothetical protein BBP40_005894 [Aspergillus hancockii]
MIRGLVPKERLLEWSVEDGWEPLCKFLDKSILDKPFPRVNDLSGFKGGVDDKVKPQVLAAIRNFLVTLASVGVSTTAIVLGVKERGISYASIRWIQDLKRIKE